MTFRRCLASFSERDLLPKLFVWNRRLLNPHVFFKKKYHRLFTNLFMMYGNFNFFPSLLKMAARSKNIIDNETLCWDLVAV